MKNFKRFHHGKPLRNLRDGDKKRLKYWVHQPRNKTKTRHKILTSNIIWLNRQAGKVKRILRSDWLPERARWAQPACSGFPAFVPQEKILLLTKLVRSRWLDIGLVLFCVVIDLEFVSVHKNAKRNWSITHVYWQSLHGKLWLEKYLWLTFIATSGFKSINSLFFLECYNFTSLTDADRKPSFHLVEPAKHDTNLGPGWFRFQGAWRR